jgi:hypothetical protein
MGCTKDPSALSALEVEAFDKIFDGNMTAFNVGALGVLFRAVERARLDSRENARPSPRWHCCVGFGCFSFM